MKYRNLIRAFVLIATFVLTNTAGAYIIVDQRMTKDPSPGPDACTRPIETTVFTTKDVKAACWVEITDVKAGDKCTWIWKQPDSDIYLITDPHDFTNTGHLCAASSIFIRGFLAENEIGQWSVEFYYNDIKKFTLNFTIKCPILEIYGEHSEETELLRNFRDSILSKTSEGQEIIKLYYQWSPAIVKAMGADEAFKKEVKEMIEGVLPLIKGEVE